MVLWNVILTEIHFGNSEYLRQGGLKDHFTYHGSYSDWDDQVPGKSLMTINRISIGKMAPSVFYTICNLILSHWSNTQQ